MLRKQLAGIKARARRLGEATVGRGRVLADRYMPPVPLVDVPDGEVRMIEGQPFYLFRIEHDAIASDAAAAASQFTEFATRPAWLHPFLDAGNPQSLPTDLHRDDICFFDIETTGLAPNMYVFLAGVMFFERDRLIVEQVFARDYAEEVGLLHYLRERFSKHRLIVTYNGISFDVPFIKTRMAVCRVTPPHPYDVLDLLRPARRTFTGVLPNCKLVTIESHLRNMERTGDIPGREIPMAYHHFVRSGNARRIEQILYHNRMDLLAMAIMMNHMSDLAPVKLI